MQFEDLKFILAVDYQDQKLGNKVSVLDVINKDKDTWLFSRTSRSGDKFESLIIKHYKVQELRRLAGLVIDREPQLIVSPSIENGMTAVFMGSMKKRGERKKIIEPVVGEATKGNTQIDYIVSMAYKRWYDRAVLDALQLYEVYSDIEAEAFNPPDAEVTPKLEDLDEAEVKVITPFVKSITDMKDSEMLKEFGKGLKVQLDTAKVSEKARAVLRSIFDKKKGELDAGIF